MCVCVRACVRACVCACVRVNESQWIRSVFYHTQECLCQCVSLSGL